MPLFERSAQQEHRARISIVPGSNSTRATTTLAGEPVEFHAERALYWPRRRTLFVADVHLGKAATFRAGGVPVPRGATANDLARLSALIATTTAGRLVVLGDFIHAAAGRVPALDTAVVRWREMHSKVDMMLIRGNHDRHAGDPPPAWRVHVETEPHLEAPFLLCHHPHSPPTGYALCGHIHPGVMLNDQSGTVRLPCFVLDERHALLPAFGRLTGLAIVHPEPGQRLIAIAGTQLFALPPQSPTLS
jgi:uncharacterized protein